MWKGVNCVNMLYYIIGIVWMCNVVHDCIKESVLWDMLVWIKDDSMVVMYNLFVWKKCLCEGMYRCKCILIEHMTFILVRFMIT